MKKWIAHCEREERIRRKANVNREMREREEKFMQRVIEDSISGKTYRDYILNQMSADGFSACYRVDKYLFGK